MQTEEDVRQRFGRKVAEAARRAGYDIDSPKGGAKRRLAKATGMTESSIGRTLAGKTLPEARTFAAIADAVGLDVRELLEEAEIIPRGSLGSRNATGESQVRSQNVTPEQAATELGILDPVDREMFIAMVERLQRIDHSHPRTEAEELGGEAAEM